MSAVFIRLSPWGHIHVGRPKAALAGLCIDSLAELAARLGGL